MPTLTIKNFKSIFDAELELGVVNVFIGPNGAGKSNILESLGILSASVFGVVEDDTLLRCGVRPGVSRLYKSAFTGKRISPHISFKVKDGGGAYSVSLHNTLDKPYAQWQFKSESFEADGQTIKSQGPRSEGAKTRGLGQSVLAEYPGGPCAELLQAVQAFRIFCPHTPVLRGLIPDPVMRSPLGLSGGRLAEAVQEILTLIRKGLIEAEVWDSLLECVAWVESLDTVSDARDILSSAVPRPQLMLRFRDCFMRKGKNTLTAHDASEGVLYVLFVAALILHPAAPKWCAIDNVDQALNPRLIQHLMRWVCETVLKEPLGHCLLMTVHNPSALDGLPLHDDRVRLFAVDRDLAGLTVVRRVVLTEGLQNLAAQNKWPLSRLWVMGHLGGVPNV